MLRLDRALAALLTLAALVGCSRRVSAPDLGALYSRAAREHDLERNQVVVIPGILGSRLADAETGRVVWGAFTGDFVDPEVPADARLAAVPMREGAALRDLTDTVAAEGVLDRVRLRLLGLPIEQAAYLQILGTLGVGGYRDQELGEAGAVDKSTRTAKVPGTALVPESVGRLTACRARTLVGAPVTLLAKVAVIWPCATVVGARTISSSFQNSRRCGSGGLPLSWRNASPCTVSAPASWDPATICW